MIDGPLSRLWNAEHLQLSALPAEWPAFHVRGGITAAILRICSIHFELPRRRT